MTIMLLKRLLRRDISDLRRFELKFEKEDMTMMLLNSLLEIYDNLVTRLKGKRKLRIGGHHMFRTSL